MAQDNYSREGSRSHHHFSNHGEDITDLECPRCGKHSILHIGDQTYSCLNCGFRRNLSKSSSEGFNVVLFIGLILLLLTLAA